MPRMTAYALTGLCLALVAGCVAPNAELVAMNERAYMMEAQVERDAAALARMKQDVAESRRQMDLMRGSEIAARLAELESGITAEEGAAEGRGRIKVLGRRGLDEAREAAARLAERGMSVSVIDRAPADDGYSGAAIYYSEGHEQEARDAAEALGGAVELRPMIWPSVFGLIIIVGGS